ncbi:hypothetical protein, partial [Moraxella catarrhalis]
LTFRFLVTRGNPHIVIHFHIRKFIPQANDLISPIHTNYELTATLTDDRHTQERRMKILLWVILIIFLIGLLVVTGVFKMIF